MKWSRDGTAVETIALSGGMVTAAKVQPKMSGSEVVLEKGGLGKYTVVVVIAPGFLEPLVAAMAARGLKKRTLLGGAVTITLEKANG